MMDEREDVWPWQRAQEMSATLSQWRAEQARRADLYRARSRRALLVAVSLFVMAAATVAVVGLVGVGWVGALGAVAVPTLVTLAAYALGRSSALTQRADQAGG